MKVTVVFALILLAPQNGWGFEKENWQCKSIERAEKYVELEVSSSKILLDVERDPAMNLTIQVKASDGRLMIANEAPKRRLPFRSGHIDKATTLILYPEVSEGLLQHRGNAHVLECHRL